MVVLAREQDVTTSSGQVSAPERRCIASGRSGPNEAMIRFVVGPDQAVVPDVAERLPGRGIWVSADRAALAKAVAKNLFARAARAPVTVPEDLEATCVRLLEARLADHLGLARRAGRAVAGLEKARAAADKTAGGLVVLAADAGQDAQREARRLAAGRPLLVLLDAERLGRVFGRERAVHVFVDGARFAADIARDAGRLRGLSRGLEMNGRMAGNSRVGTNGR